MEVTQNLNPAAQSVHDARMRAAEDRMTPGPKVPLPNSYRVDARQYLSYRHKGLDETRLLSSPEDILKAPRHGSKYVWKRRTDKQTSAWVRSGVLRPVEESEVDSTNPLAEYVAIVTPSGTYVAWEELALFEMPAQWVAIHYTAYEDWAVARLAQHAVEWQDTVEAQSRHTYTGQLAVSERGAR